MLLQSSTTITITSINILSNPIIVLARYFIFTIATVITKIITVIVIAVAGAFEFDRLAASLIPSP